MICQSQIIGGKNIGGPVGAYDGVTTAISLLDAAVTASNNNAELKRIFKDPDTLETFRLAIIVDVVNMHESCMKVLEKEGKAVYHTSV